MKLFSRYFPHSKNLANSFLFILPLLVLYEVGIAVQGSEIKNTADVVVDEIFSKIFGRNGSFVFNLLVIVFLCISVFYVEKKYRLSLFIFIPMLAESAVYALCIGGGLGFLVFKVLFPLTLARYSPENMWTNVILSLGAGVYEEIIFRLLLISLLYLLLTKLLKIKKPISAVFSVMIGAVVFAAVHYMGTLKDSFTYASFTFRVLSGLILSIIFMSRGLGVVVYTHAFYDVWTVLKPFYS